MLPFVIGGGILIALSFICDGANAGTDVFGNGTALAKFFNTVGNTAFGMMFPILAGYIAMAIGERPVCLQKQEQVFSCRKISGFLQDFSEH